MNRVLYFAPPRRSPPSSVLPFSLDHRSRLHRRLDGRRGARPAPRLERGRLLHLRPPPLEAARPAEGEEQEARPAGGAAARRHRGCRGGGGGGGERRAAPDPGRLAPRAATGLAARGARARRGRRRRRAARGLRRVPQGEFSCFLELPVGAENSRPTNHSLTDNSRNEPGGELDRPPRRRADQDGLRGRAPPGGAPARQGPLRLGDGRLGAAPAGLHVAPGPPRGRPDHEGVARGPAPQVGPRRARARLGLAQGERHQPLTTPCQPTNHSPLAARRLPTRPRRPRGTTSSARSRTRRPSSSSSAPPSRPRRT